VAANIFDRFVLMTGTKNIKPTDVVALSTICVLMAAKLEEPISPSMTRMINLLQPDE